MRREDLLTPTRASSLASDNLYNTVSSMGASTSPTDEVPSEEEGTTESTNPIEKLVNDFGSSMMHFRDMATSYNGAPEEAQEVMEAMARWLDKVRTTVNSSGPNPNVY